MSTLIVLMCIEIEREIERTGIEQTTDVQLWPKVIFWHIFQIWLQLSMVYSGRSEGNSPIIGRTEAVMECNIVC
jgi:hypothetical protein